MTDSSPGQYRIIGCDSRHRLVYTMAPRWPIGTIALGVVLLHDLGVDDVRIHVHALARLALHVGGGVHLRTVAEIDGVDAPSGLHAAFDFGQPGARLAAKYAEAKG